MCCGEDISRLSLQRTTSLQSRSNRAGCRFAYGFLKKVFEIFEKHETAIDMITTSEVGVSLTIDNERNLDRIVEELHRFGTVTIDRDMTIICVVGDLEWQNVLGVRGEGLDALRDIPVRMISYGGSNYNYFVSDQGGRQEPCPEGSFRRNFRVDNQI